MSFEPLPGVSVIIPSFRGRNRIGRLLSSLTAQTLPAERFQVIVIVNGPEDGTTELLETWTSVHPDFQVEWYRSEPAGVSLARNLGLAMATREYSTFIDDDDLIEPGFLELGLRSADESVIGLLPIHDLGSDAKPEPTLLTERIDNLAGSTTPLTDSPWVLSFNACKFILTSLLRRFTYDPDLRSGEDVAFFAQLLTVNGLTVRVPDDADDASYLRTLREDSISRQELSYDFNVEQRLQVMSVLENIDVEETALVARSALEKGQAGFIRRYLAVYPQKHGRVVESVRARRLHSFPWKFVNQGRSRDLVISYCFPSYSDTSAIVAAKVVADRGKIVDVISNDLSGARELDYSTSLIASPWIEDAQMVNAPVSFGNWSANEEFAESAVSIAEKNQVAQGPYRSLYSRSLWIGSHLAGAQFKLRNSHVSWTAEFSDPSATDSTGRRREAPVRSSQLSKRLSKIARDNNAGLRKAPSTFELTEAVTMILADEIIFTNPHQKTAMLELYPEKFRRMVEAKAVIRPHPTPQASVYDLVESLPELRGDTVNIGYFGNFYANRGLDDVFNALDSLTAEDRTALRVVVYTSKPDEVLKEVTGRPCAASISTRPFLPYLEFLNAAKEFDVLLVNDARKTDLMSVNPFLPSKYSDYLGAGSAIWGVVEEGSTLSTRDLDYRSVLGDSSGAAEVLSELVAQKRAS